ncbi:MAG: cytochrome ubiquinol oxidase subunit I [Thermodesulfobacteriota bacterium]
MNATWLIQYPVWDLGVFGGGLLIALVATVHVYVSHFAVGGGFFLVLTERKAVRENSQPLMDYVHRHTRFFLLLTMVFGALTGVGIWFTISLLNPTATSRLIHIFVFAFATEWVFFLCEIIALFIYYHRFDSMERSRHLRIGWLYALFAFLSLFVINGIVAFMLTPGKWLHSGDFWHGFFNPTFWPALFFRTFMALMLAGIFGLVTAVFIRQEELRATLVRYCAKWLLLPFPGLVLSAWGYIAVLPEQQVAMIFQRSPEILPFLKSFGVIGGLLFLAGCLGLTRFASQRCRKILAFGLLLLGFGFMGSFEWIREAGRRPFILYGLAYSNAVLAEDLEVLSQQGILASTRWARYRTIGKDNEMEAGRELFAFMCAGCHSIGGPMNDIKALTRDIPVTGLTAMLAGMGRINDYMPPFPGTAAERQALATYIAAGLNGNAEPHAGVMPAKERAFDQPRFDAGKDAHVLLAWCDQGVQLLTDADGFFRLAAPGVDIHAQLIRRGETPEIVTEGAEVTYRIEDGFQQPAERVDYWRFARTSAGKPLPPNTGAAGKTVAGRMDILEESTGFIARKVPVVPYTSSGEFHPYPLITVEARDSDDGKLLAATRFTAAVSTELGCRRCHGGPWRFQNTTGISDQTARHILSVHDRSNRTDLSSRAARGAPPSCHDCHPSGQGAGDGRGDLLNLSAAIHGFHANYMTGGDAADSCMICHPDSPEGFTRGFRGIHHALGMDCGNCHGRMEEHAVSLLLPELDAAKKGAYRLMKHLTSENTGDMNGIAARRPWVNEPDCLNCHQDFQPPETDQAGLDQWTKEEGLLFRARTDEVGLRCPACHGITHAVYPATNIFGQDRDNIQPVQYQGEPYPIGSNRNCKVCHTIDMTEEIHHPNMLGLFRNTR